MADSKNKAEDTKAAEKMKDDAAKETAAKDSSKDKASQDKKAAAEYNAKSQDQRNKEADEAEKVEQEQLGGKDAFDRKPKAEKPEDVPNLTAVDMNEKASAKANQDTALTAQEAVETKEAEQPRSPLDTLDEQNERVSARNAAIEDAAQESARSEDGATIHSILRDRADQSDDPAAVAAFNKAQQADQEMPVEGEAMLTPHRDINTLELQTNPAGPSAEMRQFGTSPASTAFGNAAVDITEIATTFDALRGTDIGTVTANPNSIVAVRSWFGQYQVRSGEGLATPNRAPDVETLHGMWWQEGDEQTGYFVGVQRGVEGVVYRLPRLAASVPSLNRVAYVDPHSEQQAAESVKLGPELDGADIKPLQSGVDVGLRPEASLTAHPYHQEGYDGARSTLGGFTGQAVAIPHRPVGSSTYEEAQRVAALANGNILRHVQMDRADGFRNETEEAAAENFVAQEKVKQGIPPALNLEGVAESDTAPGETGAEQEDARQREQFQAEEPTEEGQREARPTPRGFEKQGEHVVPEGKNNR